MSKAGMRPSWVISDLMEVIGLDKETVETMIAPDLDNYTQETRLRSHLQDFLGPSPKAKAFTDRYLAFRFPFIASSSNQLPPPSNTGPHPEKPSAGKSRASPSSSLPPSRSGQPTKALNIDDLHSRFGQGGKVYQKNRDADDSSSWSVPTAGSARGGGSGSNTPGRQAGGVTFTEAKPKRVEASTNAKGKQAEKIWDMPRSREVRRLEGIIGDLRGLQNREGKVTVDEKEDCFCQARNHPLSRYTTHCPHCGLIICKLHRPHHPCPSCHRTLQTPAQLARLVQQIQSEVDDQLAAEQSMQEQEERAKLERLAAESGGGSFPLLGPGAHGQPATQIDKDTGRKVLTIGSNAKGKGKGRSTATLTTTYSRPIPSPSRPATPPPTDIVPRPRSPPLDLVRGEKDLNNAMAWRETEDRPWGDMKLAKRGGWTYMAPAVLELVEEDQIGRRRRKGRENAQKGMGVDGRKVVGAA